MITRVQEESGPVYGDENETKDNTRAAKLERRRKSCGAGQLLAVRVLAPSLFDVLIGHVSRCSRIGTPDQKLGIYEGVLQRSASVFFYIFNSPTERNGSNHRACTKSCFGYLYLQHQGNTLNFIEWRRIYIGICSSCSRPETNVMHNNWNEHSDGPAWHIYLYLIFLNRKAYKAFHIHGDEPTTEAHVVCVI
jgi:hypothetical protein